MCAHISRNTADDRSIGALDSIESTGDDRHSCHSPGSPIDFFRIGLRLDAGLATWDALFQSLWPIPTMCTSLYSRLNPPISMISTTPGQALQPPVGSFSAAPFPQTNHRRTGLSPSSRPPPAPASPAPGPGQHSRRHHRRHYHHETALERPCPCLHPRGGAQLLLRRRLVGPSSARRVTGGAGGGGQAAPAAPAAGGCERGHAGGLPCRLPAARHHPALLDGGVPGTWWPCVMWIHRQTSLITLTRPSSIPIQHHTRQQAPRAPLPWLRSAAYSTTNHPQHPLLLHIPPETQQTSRYRPRPIAFLSPSRQHQARITLTSPFATTTTPPSVVLAMSSDADHDNDHGKGASGERNKRRVTKREWSGAVAGADGWRFTAKAAPDLQVRGWVGGEKDKGGKTKVWVERAKDRC